VVTVGNSRPWRPFLLAQEGAVEQGWAKVGNLAVTGLSSTHDGRRHPTLSRLLVLQRTVVHRGTSANADLGVSATVKKPFTPLASKLRWRWPTVEILYIRPPGTLKANS